MTDNEPEVRRYIDGNSRLGMQLKRGTIPSYVIEEDDSPAWNAKLAEMNGYIRAHEPGPAWIVLKHLDGQLEVLQQGTTQPL